MVDPAPDRRVPALMPLGSRVVGILLWPRRTYSSVLAHGPWLDALVLTTLVSAVALTLFLATSVGRQAWVDQVVASLESWGRTLNDEEYARLEARAAVGRFVNPLAVLVVTPLMSAIVAALLVAVCNARLGAQATFRQGLALVAHSGIVAMLHRLVMLPHNYMAETLSTPTNLSVYFPTLSETGLLASFFGMIDLFVIWRVFVLAIGLSVLYGRRTQPFAAALFSAYAVIGFIIAAAKSVLAGTS